MLKTKENIFLSLLKGKIKAMSTDFFSGNLANHNQ